MKHLLLIAAAICVVSCASKVEPPQSYTIEQFMKNTSVGGASFSPDEKRLLVHSNESGIFNLYEIDIESGNKTALTNSTGSSIFAIGYFPEDDRILYRSDNDGDEINHIFLRETDGTVKDLTPGKEAKAGFMGWAKDGKSFFYISTQRDPRFTDLYEMDIATFESEMIYQNDGGYGIGSISNDKNYLSMSKPITTNDSDLFIYNFSTQELQKINKEQGGFSPSTFTVDSKALYYTTDVGGEFGQLMSYDLASGESSKVYEADWDVWFSYFSENGKYRVIGVNEDASTTIDMRDMESGEAFAFPDIDAGEITGIGISDSETKMIFAATASNKPSEMYYYDLETKAIKQLTNNLNPEINANDLVEGKVVRYKSFDGLDIPAILYMPKVASTSNKVPAVVQVHGGPGGQSRLNYSADYQYLVNHGYAVLRVNNRGSSGYGKTFYQMDDQNHGDKDLKDCIAGKDYLASLAEIDKDKIGILGGSYGGFMVMAALTSAPEEFKVGVNYFGVTNWIRTLKSIPPWWESFKDALYQEMGNPYEDSVRLYQISPLFHTDKITKPFIVLQGSQDPRVLQVESDEIVEGARNNGVPVEYVVFEDEGHGFVKKKNQQEASEKVLAFLDKYLKGGA